MAENPTSLQISVLPYFLSCLKKVCDDLLPTNLRKPLPGQIQGVYDFLNQS